MPEEDFAAGGDSPRIIFSDWQAAPKLYVGTFFRVMRTKPDRQTAENGTSGTKTHSFGQGPARM